MGLAALCLAPGSASADDLSASHVSRVDIGSIYLSGTGIGVAETNWRGYDQGSLSQGFNCHWVGSPVGMDGGTTLVMQSVQCYDRVGNAYIVPGSDRLMRVN